MEVRVRVARMRFIIVFQARDDSGLDRDKSGRSGKKGQTQEKLNIEFKGCAKGLDMKYRKKERNKE